MITVVYLIAIILTIAVFTPIIATQAFKRLIENRILIKKHEKIVNQITNDAARYYENICINELNDEILNNFDKAILLSVIKNGNLEHLFSAFNVDFEEFKKEINYQELPDNKNNYPILSKIIRNRINELLDNNLITESDLNSIFLAMVNESNVLNNIIDKVKQNKVKDEISYPNIITNDEKKTVFYDHGYPEDNTILTLTKRN